MKIKNILLTVLALSLGACEKVFIGEAPVNNPENNFELFWNDFNEHYALFGVRGLDWQSQYATYRPQVDAQTSDDELWEIFKNMIAYLDDSHTFVARPTEDFNRDTDLFVSGSEFDDQTEKEFNADLIKQKYLDNVVDLPVEYEGEIYRYGKIKGQNIGYVYFNDVGTSDKDFMDGVLKDIGDSDAIIMDIRNNGGGSDNVAAAIAGRFADKEELIYTVQEKNGAGPNDFAEKTEYFSKKLGKEHFSKPLIVLTDRITVSAAEILLLHLNSFDQVTQIGTETSGDFSDTSMRRFLPNGWQYQYSIMKFLKTDGSSLDGIGHIPDVYIQNTEEDVEAGTDKVLEEAIDFIQKL